MPCSITITSVVGIPPMPNSPTTGTIRVTGTLSGECPPTPSGLVEIIVQITCGTNTGKGTATPDAAGNWSVEVPQRCACNGDIVVSASCATDPTCADTFSGILPCEGSCPTGSIGVAVGDCNPDGTRNVALTAIVTTVPPGPIVGQFDYGDGTVSTAFTIPGPGNYSAPNSPHSYVPPGPPNPVRFLWILPANCPPFTTVISGLQTCPIVCPTPQLIITSDPPSACKPDGTREVVFHAVVSNVTPQFYHWDFDDGSPIVTIQAPSPPSPTPHSFPAPGTSTSQYNVTLTVTSANGACIGQASKMVSVAGCGGEPPPPPPDDGEGFGCKALRWGIVVATVLAAIAFFVCHCVPIDPTMPTPFVITLMCFLWKALAAAAAIGLFIWLVWCPKPCGGILLLSWQIALGVGIAALCFALCCPILWIIGAALIAGAIAGFIAWIRQCDPKRCDVLAELSIVLAGVVIPVLGWLGLVPVVANCISSTVVAVITTISGAIAIGLAWCATIAEEPQSPNA